MVTVSRSWAASGKTTGNIRNSKTPLKRVRTPTRRDSDEVVSICLTLFTQYEDANSIGHFTPAKTGDESSGLRWPDGRAYVGSLQREEFCLNEANRNRGTTHSIDADSNTALGYQTRKQAS